jgi:uncharacterized repeat protein (TIGR01451 family)
VLGTLAAGETTILDITVQVNHGVAAGTLIDNCADAYALTDDPSIDNNQSCSETVVGDKTPPATAIDIVKDGPAAARPGQTIEYTLTVTDRGPADARDLIVSDPIDQTALALGTVTLPSGCARQDDTVTCEAGTLKVGESKTFVITVAVSQHLAPGTRIDDCAEARSTATRLLDPPESWCTETDVAPPLPAVPVTG